MNNYVLLYYFEDDRKKQHFEEEVKNTFTRHKSETDNNFKYIGFAGEAEPGVEGKLVAILNSMGFGAYGDFGAQDYVALYFSREKDPDNIKRKLLIGTEDMVDKDAENMSADAHRSAVQNLLAFNYMALPK
jgi:hypothetical protein